MRKRIAIAVGVAVLVAVAMMSRHRGHVAPSPVPAAQTTGVAPRVAPRHDPVLLARASLAGTVTDAITHAPITGATVCAFGASATLAGEWFASPFCATTDPSGAYTIARVLPGTFTIGAMAATYRPGAHHPGGDRRATQVRVTEGATMTAIDIALDAGGVKLTGTVSDIAGGPIAHARVWVDMIAFKAATESDDNGAFSLWVTPGATEVFASAEGYATGIAETKAPGAVEVYLTPDSSIAGTVVDAATGEPVEGAHVAIAYNATKSVLSDARGAFRISHLEPGRYRIEAITDTGAGASEGTVAAVLGATTDGVVVRLYPAARIVGHVVIAETHQPCPDAHAWLDDPVKKTARELGADLDGTLSLAGVRPGTYTVRVYCQGYVQHDTYAPIVVTDKPVDATWEVSAGGGIKGIVRSPSGVPVHLAYVDATEENVVVDYAHSDRDSSALDGSYELRGLRAGTYALRVSGGSTLHVTVRGTAITTQDLVGAAAVNADPPDVPTGNGTIRGRVVDAVGKPVSDAFISWAVANGSIAWSRFTRETRPVLSGVDGTFTLANLPAGELTVLAERRGGGEAIAKHVAVGTSNLELVIARTGAIRGVATKPVGAITDINASLESSTGLRRHELLEHSDGHFAFTDLPAGHYRIELATLGGYALLEIDLADGETKNLTVEMQALRTLHGRIVDGKTNAPIAGVMLAAGVSTIDFTALPPGQTTNSAGMFTIENAPPGEIGISGFPPEGTPYGELNVTRTPSADGDLGDIPLDPK